MFCKAAVVGLVILIWTSPVSHNSQKLVAVTCEITLDVVPLVNPKSYSILGAVALPVKVPVFSLTLAVLLMTGQASAAFTVASRSSVTVSPAARLLNLYRSGPGPGLLGGGFALVTVKIRLFRLSGTSSIMTLVKLPGPVLVTLRL